MRVGYFHFAVRHADPIAELRASLSAARNRAPIVDSLIVLPEGFNIRTFYAETEKASCNNPDVLSRLLVLSKDYLVCFVAGLIVREEGGPQPPFSSAYFVGQAQWRLISRKRREDNFLNRYTPCVADFDVAQPIEHSRARIAALICIDFSDDNASERIRRLQADESCTLLCVPACTNRILPDTGRGCLVTEADWPNKIVVMANSHPSGRSFVTNRQGRVVETTKDKRNEVCVVDT
jgi:predicted amidohydrolase